MRTRNAGVIEPKSSGHPPDPLLGPIAGPERPVVNREEILDIVRSRNVGFLRLQFTDLLGIVKNVEIPVSQVEKALDGQIMFDGSSIQGFTRIEESDMLLKPDLDTFLVHPWKTRDEQHSARIICDIHLSNGEPFAGCPRLTLKRQVAAAESMGFTCAMGPEAEFFLFELDAEGRPLPRATHDSAGYFDLGPTDKGEECRRDIVLTLEAMGFEVEAAHHEVAPGQHEIDFKYGPAVACADQVITFKHVVRRIANEHGLHASFMPKPIFGENGSGMHVHQSLFDLGGKNAFFDESAPWQLSKQCLNYIGGILNHTSAFVAVTNPLINSFKRLVPGYEAPINIAWSEKNRSPLVRIPDRRGNSTRCEVRLPDPAANPYLAFAVMIAAGLDGIRRETDPGEPVNKNIFTMSHRERRRLKIEQLPADLNSALDELEKNQVILDALGEHIAKQYLEEKREEWHQFIAHVHPWEVERYFNKY